MSVETAAKVATKTGETAIELINVNKWYGEFHVLRDINLKVRTGERIVVCGPSGSGKSTICLLYTSPSPRDLSTSRMPSSA